MPHKGSQEGAHCRMFCFCGDLGFCYLPSLQRVFSKGFLFLTLFLLALLLLLQRPSIDLLLKHPFIKRAGPTSSLKKLWSDDSDDEEESLDMPSGADNVIHNEDQMTTKHPQARPGMSSFDEQDEDEKDS